jgi:pyroglutamyl-peptidase
MKKLLLTAFEPFGGEKMNSSLLTLISLPDAIGDFRIIKMEVPLMFGFAAKSVIDSALKFEPDVILCLGQAEGRKEVTPEKIGINLKNARIPDNAGLEPVNEEIVPGGPDGIFTKLPVWDMAQAMRDAGIPSSVSYSAGTFVCNDLFYSLLERFTETDTQVGFIHLPLTPDQAASRPEPQPFSLTVEQMAAAVEEAIKCIK